MAVPSAQTPNGFVQFQLSPSLMKGIDKMGFVSPRPIQAETLPAALDGYDVLGLAPTGTGKTAGFALPILDWILSESTRGPAALILAPTRELAAQITDEIKKLSQFTRVKTVCIFGGVPQKPQVVGLRDRPDIIVACPGRLLDLIEQGHVKLGKIDTLVLDEADHMFDMGFLQAIRKILKYLPKERQNLLFSATMPDPIRRLANEVLSDPHVVELAHEKPLELIEQVLYRVHPKQKFTLLRHLFETDSMSRAIVFTRTKRGAKRLAQKLERIRFRAAALQGNMSQTQRERVMKGFRADKYDVLVATDIAARGIDVAGVSHVINYDAPGTAEAYAHRIGRTGRSERSGKACTFVTNDDHSLIRDVEKRTREKLLITEEEEFTHHLGEAESDSATAKTTRSGSEGGGQSQRHRRQRPRNRSAKAGTGSRTNRRSNQKSNGTSDRTGNSLDRNSGASSKSPKPTKKQRPPRKNAKGGGEGSKSPWGTGGRRKSRSGSPGKPRSG